MRLRLDDHTVLREAELRRKRRIHGWLRFTRYYHIRTIPDETEYPRPLITLILQENCPSYCSGHVEERKILKNVEQGAERGSVRKNVLREQGGAEDMWDREETGIEVQK